MLEPRLEDSPRRTRRREGAGTALSPEFFSVLQSLQENLERPWYERSNPHRFLNAQTYQWVKRISDLLLALLSMPLVLTYCCAGQRSGWTPQVRPFSGKRGQAKAGIASRCSNCGPW